MIVSVRQWVPLKARLLVGFLEESNRVTAAKVSKTSVGFLESWQKMWEHQTDLVVRNDD
jgi:hypothetical protein